MQLPLDNPLPFAVYQRGGRVSILWAATDADYDLWTESFIAIQALERSDPNPQIESTRHNSFVVSLL